MISLRVQPLPVYDWEITYFKIYISNHDRQVKRIQREMRIGKFRQNILRRTQITIEKFNTNLKACSFGCEGKCNKKNSNMQLAGKKKIDNYLRTLKVAPWP